MKISVLSSRFAGKALSQLAEMAMDSAATAKDVISHALSYLKPNESLALFAKLYQYPPTAGLRELTRSTLRLIVQNPDKFNSDFLLGYDYRHDLLNGIVGHCDDSDIPFLQSMALSDKTGAIAAYMFMVEGTPLPAVEKIAEAYTLLPAQATRGTLEPGLINVFTNKMRELEKLYGISWRNNNSGIVIGRSAMKYGWRAKPLPEIMGSVTSHPDSLVAIAFNPRAVFGQSLSETEAQPAPAYVRTGLLSMKAKSGNLTSPEALQAILSSPIDADGNYIQESPTLLEYLNQIVASMIENESVPETTKFKLYRALTTSPFVSGLKADSILSLRKNLALTRSKRIFDFMLDDFVSHARTWDEDSIMALTGNLDFSVPAYDAIFPVVETNGLGAVTDKRFMSFVNAMQEMTSEERATEMLEEMTDTGAFAGSIPEAIGLLVKTAAWSEKKKAIIMVFLAVMMGIMTLPAALRSFGVSGSDVAQNMDLKEDADLLLMQKNLDDLKAMMAAETGAAKQKALEVPPSEPASQLPKEAEITQELLDTIWTLEYDPKRQVSSKGAAGEMQLMEETWNELNRKHFGGKYPWDQYRFNSKVNRMFAKQYLADIKAFLDARKDSWKTDQAPLMLASYYGGIGNVSRCDFDPDIIKRKLPKTYDYMVRGSNLLGYGEIPRYD